MKVRVVLMVILFASLALAGAAHATHGTDRREAFMENREAFRADAQERIDAFKQECVVDGKLKDDDCRERFRDARVAMRLHRAHLRHEVALVHQEHRLERLDAMEQHIAAQTDLSDDELVRLAERTERIGDLRARIHDRIVMIEDRLERMEGAFEDRLAVSV